MRALSRAEAVSGSTLGALPPSRQVAAKVEWNKAESCRLCRVPRKSNGRVKGRLATMARCKLPMAGAENSRHCCITGSSRLWRGAASMRQMASDKYPAAVCWGGMAA